MDEFLVDKSRKFLEIFASGNNNFASVISPDLSSVKLVKFDLAQTNRELGKVECGDIDGLENLIEEIIKREGANIGWGGYAEKRHWYQTDQHFVDQGEGRSIHLGVDIWSSAGTPVHSPLAAKIHSFNDNNIGWDYGPTIILEHSIEGLTFFTLYGHLNRKSLLGKDVGQIIRIGEKIGEIGTREVNGGWPPHLHFQIILDIGEHKGDFPGVIAESKSEEFLLNCPDPNLILGL